MRHSYEGTILLDVSPGSGAEFDRSFLERTGHPVVVCHGPEPRSVCPLLATGGCSKFEAAHGSVFELDLDQPQHRSILARYRAMARPDVPITVIVPSGHEVRYADLLADVEVIVGAASSSDLDAFASEVEAADRD